MKNIANFLKEIVWGITSFQKVLAVIWYISIIPVSVFYLQEQEAFYSLLLVEIVGVWLFILWGVYLVITLINRGYIYYGYKSGNIPDLDIFKKSDLSQLKSIHKERNKKALLKGLESLDEGAAGYVLFLSPLERFVHLFSFLLFTVSLIIIAFKVVTNTADWDSLGGWLAVNGFGLSVYYSVQNQAKAKLNRLIQSLKEELVEASRIKEERKLDVFFQKICAMDKRVKKFTKN